MTIIQPARDVDAARRRAERIRIKARTISEQYESLRALVDEAERCEDHIALGYPSWTAYLADLFGDEPLRLPRDERIPMSQMLTEKGMSTRAIGAVLGVDQKTIVNDTRTREENSSPDEDADHETGEVLDADREPSTRDDYWPSAPTPEPQHEPGPETVTGLDGKKYRRPEPKPEPTKPRRRPIVDVASDAGWELRKATERIQRILADDRYARNSDEVARLLRGHLIYTVEACQGFVDQLPTK